MPPDLFDNRLRSLRRDRAFAQGPELFLYERAFQDCLERVALVEREFGSALLVGCPDPGWVSRLEQAAQSVSVIDPGRLFALAAAGTNVVEDEWTPPEQAFDLCLAIGTLDSVNDLPRALLGLRASLKQNSLLIGAIAGGESLPKLRAAMHAADRMMGASSPHIHPRIEPSSLASLLAATGFLMPVVDVDRVQVSYRSFDRLVTDLRRMGATNVLRARLPRALSRSARAAAADAFHAPDAISPTVETFEIVHFAAWTPAK